jgi:hypothetical protein
MIIHYCGGCRPEGCMLHLKSPLLRTAAAWESAAMKWGGGILGGGAQAACGARLTAADAIKP